MAQYSRALDLVTTSIRLAQKGKMAEAAKLFEAALKSKDLGTTLASLEKQQVAAFEEAQKANPTLASLFAEIAKKPAKKKSKAKAKPFGGKKAPPFGKKKVKAAEGEEDEKDEEEESNIDDLAPVLDEMTADDLGDDSVDVMEGDDLSLEDLDGLLEDDGVEEMPEATASDDDKDDSEEESADDSEEDDEEESSEDKESEEESAPAATASVKVVASNLAALDRLRKSAGKKPAK